MIKELDDYKQFQAYKSSKYPYAFRILEPDGEDGIIKQGIFENEDDFKKVIEMYEKLESSDSYRWSMEVILTISKRGGVKYVWKQYTKNFKLSDL